MVLKLNGRHFCQEYITPTVFQLVHIFRIAVTRSMKKKSSLQKQKAPWIRKTNPKKKTCSVWRAGTHKSTVWISRWPPHRLKLNLFWMWYGSRSLLNKLLPIFATRESSHTHTYHIPEPIKEAPNLIHCWQIRCVVWRAYNGFAGTGV